MLLLQHKPTLTRTCNDVKPREGGGGGQTEELLRGEGSCRKLKGEREQGDLREGRAGASSRVRGSGVFCGEGGGTKHGKLIVTSSDLS